MRNYNLLNILNGEMYKTSSEIQHSRKELGKSLSWLFWGTLIVLNISIWFKLLMNQTMMIELIAMVIFLVLSVIGAIMIPLNTKGRRYIFWLLSAMVSIVIVAIALSLWNGKVTWITISESMTTAFSIISVLWTLLYFITSSRV